MNFHEIRKDKKLPNVQSRIKKIPSSAKHVFDDSFVILKQPGDGSCFFASIANALLGERYNATPGKNALAHKYRHQFCDVLNEQMYENIKKRILKQAEVHLKTGKSSAPLKDMPDYHTFRKKLSSHSTWADLAMIVTIALKCHMNLYFWDEKNRRFYYGTDRNHASKQSSNMKTIIINWTNNHSHFELIVKRNDADGTIQHHFKRPKDSAVLNKIQQEYEK